MLLFLAISGWGQKGTNNPKAARSYPLVLPNSSITPRAEMDTLLPGSFSLACGNQGFSWLADPQWGFRGGTNGYGDVEKAQRFTFTDATPIKVTEAWVFFIETTAVGDADVSIKVYSVNSEGAPDVLLGTSDPVKPSNFVQDDEAAVPTSFTFSNPALVEVSDFFISVDFSASYSDMATDTISILMSDFDCGNGDESWEKFFTGQWFPISNSTDSWDMQSNFWIFPIIEFEAPSSTEDTFVAKEGLQIFPARPNPAFERVDLPYELQKGSRVTIEVYSADGRLVERRDKGQLGPGSHVENYTVSNLPAGNYVYGIITEEARIMSRFVVNK